MWKLARSLLGCGPGTLPVPARAGRVRVRVGRQEAELEGFEVEASYLNHRLLEGLLEQAAEEFGYSYAGALRIPCDAGLFLHLLRLLRRSSPAAVHCMDLQDVVSGFYAAGA